MAEGDFFDDIPKRRRAAMELLFMECAALEKLHASISAAEIRQMFSGIGERERALALTAPPQPFGRGRLPKNYVSAWRDSFLDAIAAFRDDPYRDGARNYRLIMQRFGEFRGQFWSHLAKKPRDMPLADRLAALRADGIAPETLGAIEGHLQARRVAQLYFGRYSFDRRGAHQNPNAPFKGVNDPRPSLSAYQHRRNMSQPVAEGRYGIDPVTPLLLYMDGLKKNGGLTAWEVVRRHYEKQASPGDQLLLVPGIDQTDLLFANIAERFNGDLPMALNRFRGQAQIMLRVVESGHSECAPVLAESRDRHALAAMGNTTLCLMNASPDCIYASNGLESLLSFETVPDIHSDSEIQYDWQSVSDKWAREAEALAALPKQPPPSVPETKIERVLAAQTREQALQAESTARFLALPAQERATRISRKQSRRIRAEQEAVKRENARLAEVQAKKEAAKIEREQEEARKRELPLEQERQRQEILKRKEAMQQREADRKAELQQKAGQRKAPRALTPEEEKARKEYKEKRAALRREFKQRERALRDELRKATIAMRHPDRTPRRLQPVPKKDDPTP